MAVSESIPFAQLQRKYPLPPVRDLYNEAARLYNYKDGILYYSRQTGKAKPGAPAGLETGRGYLKVRILGLKFRYHHVVWLLHKGEFPPMQLDHIDGDRRNNRIENLRLATTAQNTWNSKPVAKPFCGVKRLRNGSFSARIKVNNRTIFLGTHGTPEAAAIAYREASIRYRGEFDPLVSATRDALAALKASPSLANRPHELRGVLGQSTLADA